MGNLGRLGRYQLIEEIGHGGMGVVYRALDSVIGRLVAIKVIRLHDASDSADREFLRQRLIKEARTAGTLSHPGIVVVHEIGEQDDSAYIVMEHVSGLTVETLMRGKYSLDRGLAGRIVEQTAAALDYAHRRGIVHRDIKPGNLMLNDEGLVKVCDFGIAKIFMGDVSATRTGTVLGTPHYMSPEQLQRKAIDGRTDQYSLAVVAFQMLTGQKPFQAETLETLFFQIIYENPLEVCRRNSILTSGEAEVLARALAKEPAERYESCTKFAGDLLKAGTVAPKAMAAKAAAGAPSVTPAPAPKTESHCVRCGAVAGPGKKYCEFCALFWTDPDEPSPISVELPRTSDTSRGRSWLDPLQRVWRRLTAAGSRASSGRTN